MRSTSRVTASAVVGGLALLCLPVWARAQAVQLRSVTHVASLAAGSIQGTVQDEKGAPVAHSVITLIPRQTFDFTVTVQIDPSGPRSFTTTCTAT